MRRKKKSLVFIILLVFACLGIGYAYLTTTLSINGTTDVDRNVWDVYFDNVEISYGSVSGSQVIDEPEIVDDTTVTFHVNLKKPGDFFQFTVDAKNDGTLDAMIESFEKKLNGVAVTTLPSYLDYYVMYEDEIDIKDNQILAAGTLEKLKVRVEFKKDISPSDLPSAQELEMSFSITYIQADSNAIRLPRVYSASLSTVYVGQPIPATTTTYTDYYELMDDFGHRHFIKHILTDDGLVKASYLGFELNDNIYYIRGGGATPKEGSTTGAYNYDGIYYEETKRYLVSIFGEENCEDWSWDVDRWPHMNCRGTNSGGSFQARTGINGEADIDDYDYYCIMLGGGQAGCGD